MTTIFNQMLQMSLQASIIVCIVLFVRLLFQKQNIPQKYVCILWGLPLFRMICPISIESRFSIMPKESVTEYIPQTTYAPITEQITVTGTNTIQQITKTVANSPNMSTSTDNVNSMISIQSVAEIIWLIGIIILLSYSFVSLIMLHHNLQSSILLENTYGSTKLFESDYIKTPFVFGFFKPCIYLPSTLESENHEYIITHEQAHILRKDHITKVIAFFITVVHWFNPFAWIMFFFFGKDIEMACDELVMKQLGDDCKTDYAQTLLNLTIGNKRIIGIPLAFGEGDTKARIKHILRFKNTKNILIAAACFIILIIAVTTLTNPSNTYSVDEKKQIVTEFWQDVFDVSDEEFEAYQQLGADADAILEWQEPYRKYFDENGYEAALSNRVLMYGAKARADGYDLQDITVTEDHYGDRYSWYEYQLTATTATMQKIYRGTIFFSETENGKIRTITPTVQGTSPRGEVETIYQDGAIHAEMSTYNTTSLLSVYSTLRNTTLDEQAQQYLSQLEHAQEESIIMSDDSEHSFILNDPTLEYTQTGVYSSLTEVETYLNIPLLESENIHYPDSKSNYVLSYFDTLHRINIYCASAVRDNIKITPTLYLYVDATEGPHTPTFSMEGKILHENYITTNGKNTYLFFNQTTQNGLLVLNENNISYTWEFSSSDYSLDMNWMKEFADSIR